MQFGFYLPNEGPTARPDPLIALARRGDELGFHFMVTGDHILVPREISSPYPYTKGGEFPWSDSGEHLEQLTSLAFLAAVTERIRLVPSVMIVPYRNPLLAAKMLATLDVLSKGRLTLGVGVGWMEEEFIALDTPPFAERGAVTDEYITAFRELWTSDDPRFEGRYCRFSDIEFLPKPVQQPLPIWVGGQSRRAIRRAAQLGDGWHPVGAIPAATLEPEELAEDVAGLRRHAERAGREPSAIDVAIKAPLYDPGAGGDRRRFSGEPSQILADIETYRAVGATHLTFDARGADLGQSLERLSWLAEEVVAHVP